MKEWEDIINRLSQQAERLKEITKRRNALQVYIEDEPLVPRRIDNCSCAFCTGRSGF